MARALLIGRQALVALGMFDLLPGRSPDEARVKGRYVLENDQHVDVLVAAAVSTIDGITVRFEDMVATSIRGHWRWRQGGYPLH